MKNIKQKPNGEGKRVSSYGASKLLIESLADLITRLRIDLLQQGNEILRKIREVNDSVDIIAREIKRQIDKSAKS
jgi:hypothetical protein